MISSRRGINIVIYAITIVVMAVPEGFSPSCYSELAYSVAKMKDENNLVRQSTVLFFASRE
jgi:magnesium-transporting ATPase (P-type)